MDFYKIFKLLKLAIILWIVLLNKNCINKSNINTKDLDNLKKRYSPQSINYFYETAFHQDGHTSKENNITKWTHNPTVAIHGNPSAKEINYVKKAISILNKLNLSVKYRIIDTLKDGDINVYFGERQYLNKIFDTKQALGICEVESNYGKIAKIKIAILSTNSKNYMSSEQSIVIEEIIQSVGIPGDSYRYPNSLFFQNYNPEKRLLKIDEEVLRFLYDSLVPVNYSRVDFENDFAEILHSVNTNQKINQFIYKNNINKVTLDHIEDCFISGILYKHPKEISIYLQGDYSIEDSIQIQNTIYALNKVSNNIKMQLKVLPKYVPDVGIFLTFKKVTNQEGSIIVTNKIQRGLETMFPKRIRNDITISFIDKKDNVIKMQKAIVETLISCLGLPIKGDAFAQKGNQIVLKQPYSDIIKTIYSDEFIDGYTIEEFKKLRTSLK